MEKPGTKGLIGKSAPAAKAALILQTLILCALFAVKVGFFFGALYEFVIAGNHPLGWDCVWAGVIFSFLF